MMDQSESWKAVLGRDKTQDGSFVYGVMSTGIFCRPGCASRTPLRENVRFYSTAEEAQADGLRACLRCKPTATDEGAPDVVEEVRMYIRKHADQQQLLTLGALSRRFQRSPFSLQRTFKAALGVTPRRYAAELRMQMLKEELRRGRTVAEATYEAGFGSSSRVYGCADTQLGMTPRQYRARGEGVEISYATMQTPLGLLMIGATDRGLCFLEFGNSETELVQSLREEFGAASLRSTPSPPSDQYQEWVQALSRFLEGEQALSKFPLSLHGTAFQIKVWSYLQTIPSGIAQSYAEVAASIGHPKAVRAVASACAANRLALVIPCHRVIRGDGGLGGYRWGLDRKRALLDLERRLPTMKSSPGESL